MLLRDPDDGDDATQATFISAYTSLLGGNEVREPAAWLATIARHECAARAQARMREPLPLIDADLGVVPGPEVEFERRAAVGDLQAAIAGLPEKQQEVVVLRDLFGLQYKEVSVALGMSVASVESLLFRARRTLRVNLKPVATGALVVPLAVRDGIAQAVPLFGATGGTTTGGVIGFGLLAKLSGGPTALKLAAGVAAVAAAGSTAVVGVEHADRGVAPQRSALSQSAVAIPVSPLVDHRSGAGGEPIAELRSDSNRWEVSQVPISSEGEHASGTASREGETKDEHGDPRGGEDASTGARRSGSKGGEDFKPATSIGSAENALSVASDDGESSGASGADRGDHATAGSGGRSAPESGSGSDRSDSGSAEDSGEPSA